MKRICYLFALWLTFTCSFSQSIIKKDTTKPKPIPQITLEDITNLLPQITPKSPNVAAMEMFGNIPVSMYMGLSTIEIPLYEIKVGNLTIPLKFAYHANGNKVNDNASSVGQGWSLSQYAVSRMVKGKPDETDFANNNDLLRKQLPADYTNYTVNIPCLTPTLQTDLNAYADFGKDIERDIFSYMLPKKIILLSSFPMHLITFGNNMKNQK